MPLSPALGRQRQADLFVFKDSLTYTVSSGTARATTEKPCPTKKKKKPLLLFVILCLKYYETIKSQWGMKNLSWLPNKAKLRESQNSSWTHKDFFQWVEPLGVTFPQMSVKSSQRKTEPRDTDPAACLRPESRCAWRAFSLDFSANKFLLLFFFTVVCLFV